MGAGRETRLESARAAHLRAEAQTGVSKVSRGKGKVRVRVVWALGSRSSIAPLGEPGGEATVYCAIFSVMAIGSASDLRSACVKRCDVGGVYPGAAPCVLTYALLSEPGSKAAIDGPVRTGDERRCI